MNKEKTKIVLLQCAICSLFPLLGVFLPYVKLTVDMGDWGKNSVSATGTKLIGALGKISEISSNLSGYVEEIGTAGIMLFMMITLFVLLPVLLFVASAVWHGMNFYKEGRVDKKMALLPFGAVVLSIAGLVIVNIALHVGVREIYGNNTLVASTTSALTTIVDADNSVKMTISGQGGFWLLVLTGIIIRTEDFIFGTADEPEKRPQFVQDAIYRTKNHMQTEEQRRSAYVEKGYPDNISDDSNPFKRPVYTRGEAFKQNNIDKSRQIQTSQWLTGEPTQKSKALSGMLICLRGEYRGAQIPLRNGEGLYMGRSKECNLILSNAKASRKHCKVIYDAKEDRYLLKNYSDNGVFLTTGQKLGKGKAWKLPHGTVFLLTKEDEFRLL